jgi:hypothetical protein
MNWKQGVSNVETFRHYNNLMKSFLRFHKESNPDNLVDLDILKLKGMLEEFVVHEKARGLGRTMIKSIINSVDSFLQNNDVYIETRRVKKWLPAPKKTRNHIPYNTKQLQEILDCLKSKSSFRLRVGVHILCASGARVGFAQYLKVKHIGEFEKDGCKSILIYGDEVDEYHSFIHQEAVEILNLWLEYRKSQGEKITGESWVIPSSLDHTKKSPRNDITAKLIERCHSVDRGVMIDGRYDTAIMHGMRKRWDTVAKDSDNANYNKIEKMFAHNTRTHALDTVYNKPNLAALFVEYDKFYRGLYISDSFRLRIELDQKDMIIEVSQAQKDDKIKSLEARLERFEAFMKQTVKFD